MDIREELRTLVKGEVFDSQILKFCLREYKKPRDKISQLIANQSIIQIKKGLYVFGPKLRKGLISLEILSAALVQPSYISKEYALFFYGMIPERPEGVTCMTTKKKIHFDTPFGTFDYFSLSKEKFSIGVEAKEIPNEGGYLFASKEKALSDWISSMPSISNLKILSFFLFEESRMDSSFLKELNRPLLKKIANIYKNNNVNLLAAL
jgi:hypothetical protein